MASCDLFNELEEALKLSEENIPPENHPVFYLPCGDIHVCKGPKCPYVELESDKTYVCSLSGNYCGTLNIRDDFSTGRQTGSANPDDRGGLPVGGQWTKKVDMFSMSSAAYVGASSFGDNEEFEDELTEPYGVHVGEMDSSPREEPSTPPYDPNANAETGVTPDRKTVKVKRGARCGDDNEEDLPRRKRCSIMKADMERQAHLKQDVINTLCKLVSFEKKDGKAPKQRDSRLQDRAFVTTSAIKKYVKKCLSSGTSPVMDDIHNICIAAANVAAEEKKNALNASKHGALILKVRMRESIAALIVSLWISSLQTPYMQNQRRGADSFRPFCVGLCYALKRGVSLPDGTFVVPECNKLAESLPTLRSASLNSTTKALHASSHRGLCTLHRCISSCTPEMASKLYASSARIAAGLKRDEAAGRYDL